jgi:hypothetical protein
MTARNAGKFGRRPPSDKPRLALKDFLSGAVVHPAAADYVGMLHGWQMLGNDQYGDCVSVTWANTRRLVTATLETETYPGMDEVIEFYKTQNPGFPSEDNGMEIQSALSALHHDGGPDGVKAVAYAQVDHTKPDEVKAAIAIFGSVWTGLNVLAVNMKEFNAEKPWDYVAASPYEGGHSVITGGYGDAGAAALGGDERFITWAEETSFTDAFWSHQVEEAWIVIWPEHIGTKAFMEGVDLNALGAAYTALTGRTFPVLPPAPTPTPIPTPTPDPVPPEPVPPTVGPDHKLALAQLTWEKHEDNMKRQRTCDKALEAANKAWREARGL